MADGAPAPRLRTRRGLMFTALPAIAVLAVLGAALAIAHRDSAVDDRRAETRQLARAAALNARGYVEDRLALLATVAASPTVRRRQPELQGFLAEVARAAGLGNPGFVDRRGRLTMTADSTPGTPPVDLSDREYVQQALAGRPAVSDTLVSRVSGRPVVIFAYPVTAPDGSRLGAVNAVLELEGIGEGLRRLLFGAGPRSTVVDGAGNLIEGAGRQGSALRPAPARYPLERMRRTSGGVLDVDGHVLGYAAVPSTGWLVIVDRPRAGLIGPLDRALLAEIGALALLALVGVLLTFATARRLDRRDRALDRDLAEQRDIALQLQTSLLPELRVPHGLEAYAGYVPAQGSMAVGGDWYDLVDTEAGSVALSVGDVAGHGLNAAATMGKLRNATRSEALHASGPVEALTGLERFASKLDGRPLATVAYAVLHVATGRLRYALAGHPPPLLIRADGSTEYLEGGRSPLLGVEPVEPRPEAETRLESGDTLVVYTDGLVERPDTSIDVGLARLAVRAARLARDPARMAERLLASVEEPRRDDAAVLVVRLATVLQPSSVAV